MIDFIIKVLNRSFIRYVITGGLTFVIDFSLLVFLHDVLGMNLLVAAGISYWSSILFNFFVNRLWTFKAGDSNVKQNAALYLVLLGFNFVFNLGFMGVATHFGMHYAVAKIIAILLQVTWTYFLYKRVVFRSHSPAKSSEQTSTT